MAKKKLKLKFKKGERVDLCGGGWEGGEAVILGKNKSNIAPQGWDVYIETAPPGFMKYTDRYGKKKVVRLGTKGKFSGMPTKWICKR